MLPHHLVRLFFSALNKSNEKGINYGMFTHTHKCKKKIKNKELQSFVSGSTVQMPFIQEFVVRFFFSATNLNWDKPELADVLITAPFCISNKVHLHKWRHILFSLSSCTTPFLSSVQKRNKKKWTAFFSVAETKVETGNDLWEQTLVNRSVCFI